MSYEVALRHHIERRLRLDLEGDYMGPDEDGDYAHIHDGGPIVWVRPDFSAEPAGLRLSAVAALDVKRSAAMLGELNAWNDVLRYVRVTWSGGAVRVWGDLIIESIEPGELGRLVTLVGDHATRVGEVMSVMYGATVPWAEQGDALSEAVGDSEG